MGRDSYSPRKVIEHSAGITIQELKAAGLLTGKDLTANWNYTLVTMKDGQGDIAFKYNYNGQDYSFKQRIVRQPVFLGGYRYYFKCDCTKGGRYCGRLVKALYWGGDVYACRHCLDLVYYACRIHRDRMEYSERARTLQARAERYRKNKHPRKANRLLWTAYEYENKADIAVCGMLEKLTARVNR
jgi:hypothetical protein